MPFNDNVVKLTFCSLALGCCYIKQCKQFTMSTYSCLSESTTSTLFSSCPWGCFLFNEPDIPTEWSLSCRGRPSFLVVRWFLTACEVLTTNWEAKKYLDVIGVAAGLSWRLTAYWCTLEQQRFIPQKNDFYTRFESQFTKKPDIFFILFLSVLRCSDYNVTGLTHFIIWKFRK